MGTEDDRDAPQRRNEGVDRDRERDHDGQRDTDRDRDRDRRRDRHGSSHDNERSSRKHGESYRRERRDTERDDQDRRSRRTREDRRDRRETKEDDHQRSRSRSPDLRKRQRRDEPEGRSSRRRQEHDREPKESTEPRGGRDWRQHSRDSREERGDGGGRKRAVESTKQSGPLPDQAASFAVAEGGEPPPPPKEKPNWGTTGALAAASNAVTQADGSIITLKYHEPPDARKPPARDQWKLFVFKDGAIIDTLDLGARSCWLAGRDAAVVDLLAAHPSISKQHAVLQFRHVEKRNEFGDRIGRVKPYLLDLASANGTTLNNEAVASQRYVELRDKDLIKFGHSAREYVVMLPPKE